MSWKWYVCWGCVNANILCLAKHGLEETIKRDNVQSGFSVGQPRGLLCLSTYNFSPLATSVVVHALRPVMEISFTVTHAFLSFQFHKALAAAEACIQASYLTILSIFSELQVWKRFQMYQVSNSKIQFYPNAWDRYWIKSTLRTAIMQPPYSLCKRQSRWDVVQRKKWPTQGYTIGYAAACINIQN